MAIWSCKIGEVPRGQLSDGSDLPMRDAVTRAYREITGEEPRFIFSGWGGTLTDSEREVITSNQKLSLKCKLYGDRPHDPCSGTTDDGLESPCECWCHRR